MRVAFATGIFPPDIGGPATYVSGLASELVLRGDAVEVVTYGSNDGAVSPFPIHHIHRGDVLPLRYWRFARAVRRAVLRSDVVYLQDPMSSGLPGLLAAKSTGRPSVLKVVGDPAWELFRESGVVTDDFLGFQDSRYSARVEAVRLASRLVARGADRVLVPSRFLRNVVESWGVPSDRIEVVYNGVKDATLSPDDARQARRRLGLGDETIILSSGRLVPWKGFDTLVRLAAAMKLHRPELRWIIVGSGPWENHLRELAADLSVTDRVRFTGRLSHEQMSLYLRAGDVFVLWSEYEGLPHVLLEAMQAGTAVVASDAGGNKEVVEHGESGLLVPWGDSAGLREAIERLSRDPALRERLRGAGRARSGAFSWRSTVEGTIEVLERTIRAGSGLG